MLRPNWNDDQIQPEKGYEDQRYEVIVGLARIQVKGASRQEAIERARSRLCLEMPRMWDVIQSLDIQRFEIRELNP